MLFDTHCHIHEQGYTLPISDVLRRAAEAHVSGMICVGTDEKSSVDALLFAGGHDAVYASIGVHPHDAKNGWREIEKLATNATKEQKLVAVGEIGLDYYYSYSPREAQIAALEAQIQIALDHDLPIIFHVRDSFDDFWPIFDNFHGIRGELHSFTDTQTNLEKGFERGLYVGVNGISTFTKDPQQREMYARIPLGRMLLETDAPFLTPVPYRGTVNEPAYVSEVARHHALLRGITPEEVAQATTANATALFLSK